jgi:hypothetical protein
VATCPRGGREVVAHVGPRVEVGDGWLCEAAWDGEFRDGGFDETDVVFGSGVRIRGDEVVFVTAGAPLDRVHSLLTDDGLVVSNSLAGLLAWVGGSLELGYERYREDFSSVIKGVGRSVPAIPTTAGDVRLTYFDNLRWDGQRSETVEKPFPVRDFSTFAGYRDFLFGAVRALVDNGRAPERRHPFGLVSTVSSGYDSSASTVVAHAAGCQDAVGWDRSKEGFDDSGAPLAEALGMTYHPFETSAAPKADVLLLAAGSGDGGDVTMKAAEALYAQRLVFFGHWGDRIWGLQDRPLHAHFLRVDTSGTDMVEHRLVAGFVGVPVPMIGGRQLGDVLQLSHRPEMDPWRLGVEYDRPIARRICEEAGVPREAFGRHKRAIFRAPPQPKDFLTPELRRDYERWLRSNWLRFLRARTIPPTKLWDRLTLARGVPPTARRRIHRYVIQWAVDRAEDRYPRPG